MAATDGSRFLPSPHPYSALNAGSGSAWAALKAGSRQANSDAPVRSRSLPAQVQMPGRSESRLPPRRYSEGSLLCFRLGHGHRVSPQPNSLHNKIRCAQTLKAPVVRKTEGVVLRSTPFPAVRPGPTWGRSGGDPRHPPPSTVTFGLQSGPKKAPRESPPGGRKLLWLLECAARDSNPEPTD